MINSIKRHPVLTLLLLFLAAPAGLNYSGFCIAQGRYLSDEEKVKAVFLALSKQERIPIETKESGTQYYKQIKYSNFEEFKKENPDCCKVNRGRIYDLAPPAFIDRIFGYNSNDIISINYTAYYMDDQHNRRSQQIHFDSVLENCGAIKW